MEEVVKAIEKLAEKSIIDYLVIIVPMILSVVAIGISIATAKKQNKIALFERRYACLFQIKTILGFTSTIREVSDPKVIIQLFDAFWGTNISNLKGDSQIIAAQCQLIKIIKDVEQAEFLFEHKFEVLPNQVLEAFHLVITEVIAGQLADESMVELSSVCDKFSKKDYEILKKYTKMHFYD